MADNSDPIDEAKEAGLTRLRNPFYFSLALAFAGFNWKAIYVLLWPGGDGDALDRLNWIAGNLYESWYWYVVKIFVGPVALACLYMTVIPGWLFKLERVKRRLEVQQANALKDIEGDLHETAAAFRSLTAMRDQLRRDNENVRQELTRLQGQFENKVRDHASYESDAQQVRAILIKALMAILKDNPEYGSILQKVSASGGKSRISEYGPEAALLLAKMGLIKQVAVRTYTLEPLGKEVLASL